MKTVLVFLLLGCIFCHDLVVSQRPRPPPRNTAPPPPPPYSIKPNLTPYYKLALQWAYSKCSSATTPCSPPLIQPPQHRFTIHGLWPDYHPREPTEPAPEKCRNMPYLPMLPMRDQKQITDMDHYWPDVENYQRNNARFWKKQWDKHGTCTYPQLGQQLFFTKAVGLVKSLRLEAEILGVAGSGRLVVGALNSVNVTELVQKNKNIGVFPEVECNKKQQLLEVRVCYDAFLLKKIDCPYQNNNCPKSYELPK